MSTTTPVAYNPSLSPIVGTTQIGDLVIGTGYAGTCYSGGIGTVLCYNKMLSDAELTQVYNATKTYYGL